MYPALHIYNVRADLQFPQVLLLNLPGQSYKLPTLQPKTGTILQEILLDQQFREPHLKQ